MSTDTKAAFHPPICHEGDIVLFSTDREGASGWTPAYVYSVGEGGRLGLLVIAGYNRGSRDGVCHKDDPLLADPRLGDGILMDAGGVWKASSHVQFRNQIDARIEALEDKIDSLFALINNDNKKKSK